MTASDPERAQAIATLIQTFRHIAIKRVNRISPVEHIFSHHFGQDARRRRELPRQAHLTEQ